MIPLVIETSKTSVYFTFKERRSFYEKNKQINKPYTLSIVTLPNSCLCCGNKANHGFTKYERYSYWFNRWPFYRCINSWIWGRIVSKAIRVRPWISWKWNSASPWWYFGWFTCITSWAYWISKLYVQKRY